MGVGGPDLARLDVHAVPVGGEAHVTDRGVQSRFLPGSGKLELRAQDGRFRVGRLENERTRLRSDVAAQRSFLQLDALAKLDLRAVEQRHPGTVALPELASRLRAREDPVAVAEARIGGGGNFQPAPHDPGGALHGGDRRVDPRDIAQQEEAEDRGQEGGRRADPNQPAPPRGRRLHRLEHAVGGLEQRVHLAVVEIELARVRVLAEDRREPLLSGGVEAAVGHGGEQRLELGTDFFAGDGHHALPSE